MIFQLLEKIPNQLAPSPVNTSMGPARVKRDNQEIAIYQPTIFPAFTMAALLGMVVLIGFALFYGADTLADIFGPKMIENIILTTYSSGFIGLGVAFNSIFNRTVTKIYIVTWQNYLYYNAAFGVISCAPINQVSATLSEDNFLILVMNDIETFIDMDTIHDAALRESILRCFNLETGMK